MGAFDDVMKSSVEDRDDFWLRASEMLQWVEPPLTALDSTKPLFYRWFPDGRLNVAHNALDRHVEAGRGDCTALVYDSPVTGVKRIYTYTRLRDEVAVFAGGLRELGVNVGDRVVIYMPMIPEAVIAMLACARIGAVHSVVFGGFAAKELAARIDDATPTVIVSATCGIEGTRVIEYKPLLDRALELAHHAPARQVIFERPQATAVMGDNDIAWTDVVAAATPAEAVPVRSTDPLYILYTSGTTGPPKGVVRDSGGYATALAWSMRNVYDVGPGQAIFTASDIGWVVGHSYIVYGPLLAGATTVLYEGKPVGTPDAGQFWRVCAEHSVRSMFTAPTALRAIKQVDPDGRQAEMYDLSELKYLFLAGERLDPETHRWATGLLSVPVLDHWWQTETGWPMVANPAGIELLEIKPGSPSKPLPGWDVRVLDSDGHPVASGEDGAIAAKLPLPPGAFSNLWNDDERFLEYMSTYDGYYLTGDGGRIDADGYVYVMGRMDDIVNVAGHRLSTGAMEEVLASHPDVAECAVIGVADPVKGQIPRAFVVLKSNVDTSAADHDEEITAALVQRVREQIGAVASLKDVAVVPALPKTRSGKILRKTMRRIADGHAEKAPSTIDDARVLDALAPVLRRSSTAALPSIDRTV
ncbi:AMP-binding protein [Rhodococcus sp. LB1]|uniref:AMP-binding protein n=1 Tax=Rhodococcus sp. LB1 TaxID=1807499 RepID=UPI00077AE4BC|nr:propionyl-CoA synthetase [Rhodococcus sp. LB1]